MNEQKFDCILQQGELDRSTFPAMTYLDNDKYKCEVILHNVSKREAIDWCTGPGMRMVLEIEEKHPEPYYHVSAFWAEALED